MANARVRLQGDAAKELQNLTTSPQAEVIPQDVSQEEAGHRQGQDSGKIHDARTRRHSSGYKNRCRRQWQAAFLEQRRTKDHAVAILMKKGIKGLHSAFDYRIGWARNFFTDKAPRTMKRTKTAS